MIDLLHNVVSYPSNHGIIYNECISHVFESIYIGIAKINGVKPWWKRILMIKQGDAYENAQHHILYLYLWNQLNIAKRKGDFPTWEGIRLIREHV
ncbi:MAG: hypothetical protein SFH39_16305 [Candidatus Magnetobacterium sp. LHC-1]|uniref:Uncharacterized protein n=1 Tax=Candidatus Magnetobacterium casense TaxID=1455061 RepID=A0ABS6RZI8_9BACT|nr:hypothetical protein [Candidatus Magnetobacterium casensis]MBV6341827.1 hypothetical protein [Candidatus Magnetobacterium casensis]